MANPSRRYDDPQDPRLVNDPANPRPPLGPDPLGAEPRIPADMRPAIDTGGRSDRGIGTSVMIAAVVLLLAAVAYFVFGPRGAVNVPSPQPAVTTPAPEANAPAPAQQAAPTEPAPAPTQPQATPTEPTPAQPNPAMPAQPAPAQ